ncbi:hypothetical protein JCM10449v2_004136 [Rhodotorula kratochvilovae]
MPSQPTLELEQFRPSFSDSELADLEQAIKSARLPAETYASRQNKYGVTHAWMKQALERWQTANPWKAYEAKINEVDHFTTTVEDEGHAYKVHFLYHESKDPNAIPLLLLHGWPGSAFEFVEVIKLLRESTNPSFHLIAPMEPGYGWSSGPPLDRGFGMFDCARLLDKLMTGLGYGDSYAVQGGDIGSGLARILAVQYDGCKAINVNYLPAVNPSEHAPERKALKPHELASLERSETFQATGRGYALEQGTRPGTIGIVVGSSPVALLAWLGEKYAEWTDGDLPLDDLLSIATFWWLRDSYPSSIWAYAELLKTGISAFHNDPQYRLEKPFGYSSFAKEISATPEAWAGRNGNLQFFRFHEKGGHFAAAERPEEFAQDMVDCFGKIFPRS